MEIDISKRREKERKICDKIHKEMEMIKKSNLLLVDRDNMDDVIVTIKRRGKKGRFVSAKTIPLNKLLKKSEPNVFLFSKKPSKFDFIFKTKKYYAYLERTNVNIGAKLQRNCLKNTIFSLMSKGEKK